MSEQPVANPVQTLSESLLSPAAVLQPVTLTHSPVSDNPHTNFDVDEGEAALSPKGRLGRFELHGEIGRGGMGTVLRGRDPTLGREVAIKVLLQGRRGNADATRRFQEEAQIGGQLQHPGLVPVYEMGADGNGRPFFAMKLVDGQTLAALLTERQRATDDLPRFLTVFEQICQAVGYAHARGVIHRDLKPANIMVGAFGEVQVMDWGLAKVLGGNNADVDSNEPTASRERSVRTDSEGSHSRDGSVMGTPAYMPPEQARGEIDRLDRRSDVFGLGAILCEILTGHAPFSGISVSDTLGRAARGDLSETFSRLDGCGADPELTRLTKACLSADPDARPLDGSAVAERVAANRAGVAERLRRAELERAAAEVRAVEERKRRRTQLGLAGALLLLLLLAGGGGWYLRHQQNERRQEQDRKQLAVERALERDLAEVAEQQGKSRWTEAWAALERAEGRLAESGPEALRERVAEVRGRLEQVRTDRDMVARLEECRIQVPNFPGHRTAEAAYRDAFAWYGLDVVNPDPESVAAKIRDSAIREELVSGLYQWAVVIGQKQREDAERLVRIGVLADPDPWRRQIAGAAVRQDRVALLELAGRADPARLSPANALLVAVCFEVAGHSEKAVPVLREVQRRHPDDFLLNFALAQCYMKVLKPEQPEEAVRFYTAATALRPRNAGVFIGLGNALGRQSKRGEAILAYREACRLEPGYAEIHTMLGFALLERSEWSKAEFASREAIRLKPDAADAHNILGIALRNLGKLTEAEVACRQAIRLNPQSARSHFSLGFVLRKQGKIEASLAAFRRGHELARATGWRGPTDQWLREAERLAVLAPRLPEILTNKVRPASAAEGIEIASLCSSKHRYAAATRFYADAFKADSSLASDLVQGHRYNAAAAAALAADGKDEGSKQPDESERARLRGLALGWLRDDVAAWGKLEDGGKPEDRALVESKLRNWQLDADLVTVRGSDALAKLAEVERTRWQEFWADVDALLKRDAPK